MSRHYVEKVLNYGNVATLDRDRKADTEMSRNHKQLHKSNYVRHPMTRHHNNMAMTLTEEGKDCIVQMSQHRKMSQHLAKA